MDPPQAYHRPWIPSHPPSNGPVRVLALDGAAGGALRGYAQIKIVRALMQSIWRANNPGLPIVESEVDVMRPCDHFNMIFGSGTGGAIAVYLGRLNLSIKECEDYYKQLGDEVYAHPCSSLNLFYRFNYDPERLERVLKEQTRPFYPANLDFGYHRKNSPECKAAVLTKMVHNTQAVHVIKSYEVESGQIWEAIRATTAAYYDFPNIKVGRLLLIAPDAGFSNPSGKAWIEATALYPRQNHTETKGIWFISVGSGVEPDNPLHTAEPNALELGILRGLRATRMFVEWTLSGAPAQAVITSVSLPAAVVLTWAGYGWEFVCGSLPGRAEGLRVLAHESHKQHMKMRQQMRRPFVESDLGKLHYYRLDLKLEHAQFEYDAWQSRDELLKLTFSPKNTALLSDAPLMQGIKGASKFHAPNLNHVRVLALDGSPGALSALVQLKILRELMKETWREIRRQTGPQLHPLKRDIDDMRPADYFDLIVGSGNGGAIAIYLGWFRFTIKECEDHFHRMGDQVYSAPYSRLSVWRRHNYDQSSLENLLQDQARSCDLTQPQHGDPPKRKTDLKFCYQQREDRRCKVAVLVSKYPYGTAHTLRSYGENGVDGEHDVEVWQAIRATMASHGDFPPVQIGNVSLLGPDAGRSNPAIDALKETWSLYGRQKEICFVSIGNGLHPEKAPAASPPTEVRIQQTLTKARLIFPSLWAVLRGKLPAKAYPLRDLAIGCENENRKMLAHMRPKDLQHYFDPDTSKYFRFNIEDFRLSNAAAWNATNKEVVEQWAADEYLGEDIIQNRLSELQSAAKQL